LDIPVYRTSEFLSDFCLKMSPRETDVTLTAIVARASVIG
jgi:hypothetical protein